MTDEKRPQRTQIMTLKEVAKYLGVHSMTVYRLLTKKSYEIAMFRAQREKTPRI